MKQKRLMLLGGLRYLLPVIEAAHKLGCYVITCDYLPNNIAHKYSDEYCNVSIIDKEAVLKVAQEKQIDGIMSFAVDPGVVTAAYVAEKMGLPSPGPYESICILQNKDRFRQFLQENGFNCPKAASFTSLQQVPKAIESFSWPLIVKPTDSAGSKGVQRIDSMDELNDAFAYALDNSITGKVIVEEYIEKEGCSSDTDSFSVEGELKFVSFNSQYFDEKADNPYTPSAFCWPSTMTQQQEQYLTNEIQRALHLLKMRTSIYNIETRISKSGIPYIMELTPRGGGNRLAEVIRYATGVDMITNMVRAALNLPILDVKQEPYKGVWAEVILHANESGKFVALEVDKQYQQYVVETDLWVKPGDSVETFKGANNAIGTIVLNFDKPDILLQLFQEQTKWVKVMIQ